MNRTTKIASRLALVTVCLLYIPLFAQTAPQPELYALVIGVTEYEKAELNGLRFPEKDAEAVSNELKALGYTKVDLLTGPNATKSAITEKLDQFSKRGSNKGIVLVFLSGHGTEIVVDDIGTMYFSPYDTEMKALRDAMNRPLSTLAPTKESMVPIDDILLALKESKAAHRILITDCCRDDAARSKQMRTKSFGSSSGRVELPDQTLMLLSCKPGQTSVEHDDWGHGALTKCFLEELRGLGDSVRPKTMGGVAEELLPAVELMVDEKSRGKEQQTPYYINKGGRVELILKSREHAAKSYVSKSTGMEFVLIPAGTFTMGSPETELGNAGRRESDETQHRVTISKQYYLGKYEVSQTEFESVMGFNPSFYGPSNALPVERVTWFDAVMFCNKLSEKDGRTAAYTITNVHLVDGTKNIQSAAIRLVSGANGYRLPTEAEWEHACRSGTTTAFNTGTTLTSGQANIESKTTMPVKSFKPNAFGLHNMHGNVWEWCWDYYADYDTTSARNPQGPVAAVDRVYRGGGNHDEPVNCRSANRETPVSHFDYRGFRVSLPAAPPGTHIEF